MSCELNCVLEHRQPRYINPILDRFYLEMSHPVHHTILQEEDHANRRYFSGPDFLLKLEYLTN